MFKKRNKMIISICILVCIGLYMVYSSSRVWANMKYDDEFYYVRKQIIFAILGIICMFLCSKVNLLNVKKYNKIVLILGFFSLILVLVPGIGIARNGSRSWFGIASFLIQPSEFFKVILILNVSGYLSKKKKIKKLKDFKYPLFLMVLGFLLILLQPDFGSGMVMVCSIIVILFCANVPFKYFIFVAILGVIGLSGLIISAPYRMERILSFLNPWQDPLGSGFQIIQSLYAIGPGGLFGLGMNNSIQKRFYLPEPQTDFIFSIFGEEFGFIGSLFLILLFIYIIYLGIQIALESEDVYISYVKIGIISVFAIQVMINLGVVIGLFPVTGITLPLFSYGGSSMMVVLSCFGLLLSNTKP